ncbi:hypothetical protein C1H71_19685 [Iodobacter fluviatilis]|uniref:Uncharacterized protein n=1 Tax=Iodobacter fluviatilis TaxID=537 RepID=A0A7G3GDH1_9NEIS|nr:hypothetical protein C1H71_19685 [Iodobacter fluviatilis]
MSAIKGAYARGAQGKTIGSFHPCQGLIHECSLCVSRLQALIEVKLAGDDAVKGDKKGKHEDVCLF